MNPEFRLYYDDNTGKVICYSCSPLDIQNPYILIDAQTYAETRPDLIIIDGKIRKHTMLSGTIKLIPSNDGTSCAIDDISIITTDGEIQKWNLKINES